VFLIAGGAGGVLAEIEPRFCAREANGAPEASHH